MTESSAAEEIVDLKTELEVFLETDEHHLVIDDTDLDRELTLQAARYFFYTEKAILAEREYDLMRHTITRVRAEVEKKIRSIHLSAGGKGPTVSQLESEVDTNPGVVSLELKLLDLKCKRDTLKNLKESMWMRKDLLIQKAIAKRSELESLRGSTVKERT